MKCIILCAGKGSRMGGGLPKALLPIKGKPLFRHVMEMWETSVDGFIFVVGHRWEEVVNTLPSEAEYVVQNPQRGIADAILQAERLTYGEPFVVALGDCVQRGEWILPEVPIEIGVGVWETDDQELIRRSNSVEIDKGCICRVVEKPKEAPNNYCGMGTYFFDNRVVEYIKKTPVSSLRGEVEITDTIQLMILSGERITPVFFNGEYLNVTYPEDLQKAEELLS